MFGLQPHRRFKVLHRDIVGCTSTRRNTRWCCAWTSQIQALSARSRYCPWACGYVEGVTHDYVRHGTTTLFGPDVSTVLTRCKQRHRHQEYLSFLRHIEANMPAALDVHLIVDNYATHKHARVKAWLAKRPRYHVHYTPTYATWINQVERWFGIISDPARGRA